MTGNSLCARFGFRGRANFFITPKIRRRGWPMRSGRPPAADSSKHVTAVYQFAKLSHETMFIPGTVIAKWGAKVCANANDPDAGTEAAACAGELSKAVLFHCKDCGDCSLPEIAYLCPESQCAKNQRNGPCGGTREGRCEVDGYGDCIWLRAYERLKHDGREQTHARSRASDPKSRPAQNLGVGEPVAWPRPQLETKSNSRRPHPSSTGV